MNDQRTAAPGLFLPVQAAPVYRSTAGVGAAGGSGVEASGWFDDVLKTVNDVTRTIGAVGQAAGPILGAFGI